MRFVVATALLISSFPGGYSSENSKLRKKQSVGAGLASNRRLQSPELSETIDFGSGSSQCLALPSGRVPDFETSTSNDGWKLVNFCLEGLTGNDPATSPDCHYNDDDSSSEELLFTFTLFGEEYTEVFINNNGNLSFGSFFSRYTSTGFPVNGYPMVAPFWADIDTGDAGDSDGFGRVWRKQVGDNKFAVAWDHVGYFNENSDKRNTFQVLISDGFDSDMGIGNNVCFCYADMDWTTGDASSGIDGFGGTPATVGANLGNGVDYFEIGLYDDQLGVDGLDGQSICFSASGLNVPPIVVGLPPNGLVALECDASLTDLVISFDAPESQQTTTVVVTGDSDGLEVVIVDGIVTATATINWTPDSAANVVLQFNATDSEGASTLQSLTISSPGPCNVGSNGDPHFKTWKQEHFEYHGQCDLVLAKDENFAGGLGLDVQIRTKLVRYWSYIKSTAIRIDDDILEVEGSGDPVLTDSDNLYWVNFELQGELKTIGGFPVTYKKKDNFKRHFEIDLSSKYPHQKIEISTWREFVRVDFVKGEQDAFGNTVGMLGDYKTGKTLARDGVTVMDDFNTYGNEWQVLPVEDMLFHAVEEPQFPQGCILPENPRGERRRRLGEITVTEEQAEAACAFIVDPLDRKDCIYDILATQDLDMVGTY